MRRLVKTLLAGALHYSGLLWFLVFCRRLIRGGEECVILTYHRVMPPADRPSPDRPGEALRSLPGIVVSPATFAEQIAFLARRHTIISLEDLVDCLTTARKIPKRAAVVTFDDGWRDNYEYAFLILRQHGVPATVFLTTGFVGTDKVFWPEQVLAMITRLSDARATILELARNSLPGSISRRITRVNTGGPSGTDTLAEKLIEGMKLLPPEKRNAVVAELARQAGRQHVHERPGRVMLNWEEVHLMRKADISFGAHGATHEILTGIGKDRQHEEIFNARDELMQRIPRQMPAFAYPNGNYSEQIQTLVREAGYSCALSVRRGVVSRTSDLFALPRVSIHENASRGLRGRFSGALFALRVSGFRW